MRSQRETSLEKCMQLLESLKLTPKQLNDLEGYLSGEKGEEVLSDLPYQNLSTANSKFAFIDLYKRMKTEEVTRLFHILFEIGGTTSSALLPYGMGGGDGFSYLFNLPVDKEKAAVLYAAQIGAQTSRITSGYMQRFIKQIDHDTDILKRAYLLADYPQSIKNISNDRMHNCGHTKLILLASYFLAKYPDAPDLSEREEKQGSLLSEVSRFFKKTPEIIRRIEKEDIPLMQQYEDILLGNLGNIYEPHTMPASALQEIIQAIRENKVTDQTLKLANRKCKLSTYTLHLLGGTALFNFHLSDILKNVVKVCFAADIMTMFTSSVVVTTGLWMDVKVMGGDYDELFAIDRKALLLQAASRGLDDILKTLFRKDKTLFMEVLDNAKAHESSVMMRVLEQEDHLLFLQQRKNGTKERDKLIDLFADKNSLIGEVKKYLRGETEVSSLYPYEDQIHSRFGYGGNISQQLNLLHSYAETYSDQDFYNRVIVYQFLKGSTYFFYWKLLVNQNLNTQKVRETYASFDAEHLDTAHQLKFYSVMYQYFYQEKHKDALKNVSVEVFCKYLTVDREKVLSAFRESDAVCRAFAIEVLGKNAEENKTEILAFSQDSSKLVKESLYDALHQQRDWETEILKFLSSKKASERELAVRVLAKWDLEKYQAELSAALEKEKNNKVRTLLLDLLNTDFSQAGGVLTLQDLVKELHKGEKKRTLAWAYETPFSEVHKKSKVASVGNNNADSAASFTDNNPDNTKISSDTVFSANPEKHEPILAEEDYLQAILLCYSSMTTCGINKDALALAAELDEKEFAVYVNELFDKWLALGAEAKKRWVLYAAAIHGGTEIIKKLQHQISEWPQHSRGAIASDAVQALALNPNPEALLIVDSISRKFKFRQVKAAAGEALKFAAEQLGITTEELADRIVPNLGFDENMERHFDYGTRQFTVTITPALEIEVFDESGKKLKNLPAPGKRDDPERSAESYAAFKEMKKQMKTTVASQKMRLELALSTERQWSCEAWKKLFVENPIMHQFAIGLIWGIYEGKRLTQTFRYMEDGSFNTEEEEEFVLPEDDIISSKNAASAEIPGSSEHSGSHGRSKKIGLVHPVELSEESISAWKTQLEDYEITQPIEQLSRPVYHMTEEEAESKSMERFGGCILNDLSLIGKMQNMGWYRGYAEDAGIFSYFYREDKEQDLKAELNFSGTYVAGENEDVTVYDVTFSKKIKEIPERYFSEIVMQTAKAVSSSQEKDKFWKDNK